MKKITISLLLFLFIFTFMGIPYTHWWFNGCDDFLGLSQGYHAATWRDLFYFFYDGNIAQGMGPSNYHYVNTGTPSGFFSTYYRPLYLVYLTLQYWTFGTNAYGYFLCNVFFHAINSVLLFNIFSYITSYLPALLGALFFAFHPQIAYRFGAIVNLHYYVQITLVLLTLIFFFRYLDSGKLRFYAPACLMFTLALFTRESCIVLPAIIFLGTWLYRNRTFFFSIKTTFFFWFIALAFLALRMYLYPITWASTSTHTLGQNLTRFLHTKPQEFLVFLYDCFGLSWLPWGHKIIRGGILGVLIALTGWLFIKNSKKISILFCATSAALMLWPGLIGCYSPRYIYEALPFIIGMFILLFEGYQGKLVSYKNVTVMAFGLIIFFYIILVRQSFRLREQKMQTNAYAVKELIQNPLTHNRAICFLSYPMDGLGDQPSDIIRVMRHDTSLPVFCDTATALVQAGSHIVVPKKWYNAISPLYTKNYVTITPVPGGFRYHSTDASKIHFFVSDTQNFSLGKKIVNTREALHGRVVITEFTLLIDQEFLDANPIFAAWNYEKPGFDILPKPL